jgi:hypothetical protein
VQPFVWIYLYSELFSLPKTCMIYAVKAFKMVME